MKIGEMIRAEERFDIVGFEKEWVIYNDGIGNYLCPLSACRRIKIDKTAYLEQAIQLAELRVASKTQSKRIDDLDLSLIKHFRDSK